MSVIATALKHMLASGMPHEAIVAAIAEMEACGTRVRSSGAERQARYRARLASQSDGCDVTTVTVTDEVSPKKETSPTPPKEKTTPSQSETNVSSKTPRQALETVLDADRAASVLDHRKRIGKPMTARAAELLAGKFAKCPDANLAADAMVANGWQGFEPSWMDRQQARSSSPPNFTKPERRDPFKDLAQELSDAQHRNNRSAQHDWDDAQGLPILAIDYHG